MKKLLLLLLLPFTVFSQSPFNCVPTTIIINLDQYQSETSWDIKDVNDSVVAYGDSYWAYPDYANVVETRCLPIGPLTFTIYDSYGDGLNGALWGGLDGSYYLIQCNDTLVYGDIPSFLFDTAHAFGSDACPPVFGCMDPLYLEFNPLADTDDGSCTNLTVFGCTDSTMYNYDTLANKMALIPNCDYILTLTDLVGDGWTASELEVRQDTNVWYFSLDTALFSYDYTINLSSPQPVLFKFSISSQASQSAAHCGFKLTNPLGQTMIEVLPPFISPLFTHISPTYCGNLCIEKTLGCMDSLAVNYIDTVNTDDGSCYYAPGCTNSSYLEYYTQNFVADYNDGSCVVSAIWGCIDATAFNYDNLANIDNGGCIDVVTGCMQPLAFNYNAQANTPDTCIAVVYGCMSAIALNYNSLANTDDNSCIGIIYGCTDSTMWNYSPSANVDNSSCLPYVYGCTDATMWNYNAQANTENGSCIEYIYGCTDTTAFNYDPLANTNNDNCMSYIYGCTDPIALNYCDTCNTDDFSCILPIYGCTDSTMFNYNPLANVDNSSCISFIYGCTDPSMLNYNPSANTENFSCISYIYGCMDSTAFNYNPLANTENNSCIVMVEGCMDPFAYNYLEQANVNDSIICLYNAECITGPGEPYWLNDPCYAWVLEVDEYCCENEWDTICQATYDYCEGTWSGPLLSRTIEKKKLLMITDLLGRPAKEGTNKLLFYIYNDGTVIKKLTK